MFMWYFGNMLFSIVPNFSLRTNREQLVPFPTQNINAKDIPKFKKVAQNCFIFVLNYLLKFLQVLFLIVFLLVFTIFLFPSAESQDIIISLPEALQRNPFCLSSTSDHNPRQLDHESISWLYLTFLLTLLSYTKFLHVPKYVHEFQPENFICPHSKFVKCFLAT